MVASPNVSCFLRLVKSMTFRLDYYEPELLPGDCYPNTEQSAFP